MAGESKESINKSPLIQKLKNKDIEVLLLDDPIDEFCVQNLAEYESMKVQNAAKGDLKLDDDEQEKKKDKKIKEMYKSLTEWWKKHLGKKVEKVEIGKRLVDTACAISTSEHGYSASMQKIQRAQAFANQDKDARYIND